ncbi:YncE family protein [Paenibacillus piscarius]|uniref:YncE family protein n=1 Tax=Paenibacillus piscarius TaxID=1089681 RepID=UPI001EE799D0
MYPNKVDQSRKTSRFPYVYASFVANRNVGYVAVIDATKDVVIKVIQTGVSPSAICTDPSGERLYVTDNLKNTLSVFRTDNFSLVSTIPVGFEYCDDHNPVAVFVEPTGRKAYVANYGDEYVTIIDTATNTVLRNEHMDGIYYNNPGRPFAFAGNKNSPFVYVACKRARKKDYIVAIDFDEDKAYSFDPEQVFPAFDKSRNPLTVHPDGHTQVTLANFGFLNHFNLKEFIYNTTSMLDNTASGVYLDNKMLFCTVDDRNYLKVFENLAIDLNGNITNDGFKEIPSYRGQDKIRTSLTQKYIGVTVQPTDLPTGGLQIIDVKRLSSRLVALNLVGDMAFFADSKAYVGEINAIRPIDLESATAQFPIDLGNVEIRNIYSNYTNQS